MNIGEQIMNDIIEAGLLQAESRDVIVWASNAPEVLEAIVMKCAPELIRRVKEATEVWNNHQETVNRSGKK